MLYTFIIYILYELLTHVYMYPGHTECSILTEVR